MRGVIEGDTRSLDIESFEGAGLQRGGRVHPVKYPRIHAEILSSSYIMGALAKTLVECKPIVLISGGSGLYRALFAVPCLSGGRILDMGFC